MKALIVRARMVANVLHLGGRYEGARTLGECADALETLFAQANEAVARLNEAVAVEKAYGFTIQEFQGDLERERENTRRCQRELNKALDENDRLTHELADEKWSAIALRQDVALLSRLVGRATREMVFQNSNGTLQTPTVHVLADGRAYAPILGSDATLYASVGALARAMEPMFGPGFRFVCVQQRAPGGAK